MSDGHPVALDCAEAQVAMFAEFVCDGGAPGTVSRAALARRSGIPDSTLKGWAGGAAMPLHGFLALSLHLPGAAINRLCGVVGKRLCEAEAAPADWDHLAADAAGLVGEICEARRDGQIDHLEDARLRKRARGLIPELQAAVG